MFVYCHFGFYFYNFGGCSSSNLADYPNPLDDAAEPVYDRMFDKALVNEPLLKLVKKLVREPFNCQITPKVTMNKTSRVCSLVFIVILAISRFMVFGSVRGDISKPSVPEFTVKLVAHPYDVPSTTTSSIDQYTGKEIVTTHSGYHVENKSIEVTIRNQPFTPYTDASGNEININYNVRVKGHFTDGEVWHEVYPETQHRDVFGYDTKGTLQSNSGYTVISCSADYPAGAQVDFQVEALEGYFTKCYPFILDIFTWVFTGELSGWSNTQTLNIDENTVTTVPTIHSTPSTSVSAPTSPTQNPTAIPAQSDTQTGISFGFDLRDVVIALLAAVVVVLVLSLVSSRRRSVRS
jgi:hypothetical protein